MTNPSLKEYLEQIEKLQEHCWLFAGYKLPTGYGIMRITLNDGTRHSRSPHRIMYEHHKGEIPYRLDVDHLCRVRCCINPDHLEAVSRAENVHRGLRGLLSNPDNVCKKGHKLTPENSVIRTQVSGSPGRYCKTCHAERTRRKIDEARIRNETISRVLDLPEMQLENNESNNRCPVCGSKECCNRPQITRNKLKAALTSAIKGLKEVEPKDDPKGGN